MNAQTSILIVDDDVPFGSSLKRILGKVGYDIVLVDNGAEALDLLSIRRFDLVITDFRLGALSGLDVISSIRSKGIPVRVLLLTAFGDEESTLSAEELGADARLSKPVKRSEILDCVSRLLSREIRQK